MGTPKASLIIPVYNFENYIVSTLETVFKQDYSNLEIIVVNDGSTDNSSKIVASLQKEHGNLHLIDQENQGVSTARNVGIEAATGDYILFADADDLLNTDYVSYLVNNAINNNADISIGTGIYTNYRIGNLKPSDSGAKIMTLSSEDALIKMLTYWYPIGCYCRAFKKCLFDSGLRFISGQKVGEGFTFNIKALQLAKKIAVGNKPIYCYRRDNSASCMTNFKISRAREAVDSLRIIRSLFDNPSDKITLALDYAEWHTKGDMYNWMAISDNGEKFPDEFKDYYQSIRHFAKTALGLNLNRKEKFRAFLQTIHPKFLTTILKLRKNI